MRLGVFWNMKRKYRQIHSSTFASAVDRESHPVETLFQNLDAHPTSGFPLTGARSRYRMWRRVE